MTERDVVKRSDDLDRRHDRTWYLTPAVAMALLVLLFAAVLALYLHAQSQDRSDMQALAHSIGEYKQSLLQIQDLNKSKNSLLKELTSPKLSPGQRAFIISQISALTNQTVQIAKDGRPGPPGPAGPVGPVGVPGTNGSTGLTGATGQSGSAGAPGQPGRDSTVAGPEGSPGPAGSPGAAGARGDTGPRGEKGDNGSRGDTGAPAPTETCSRYVPDPSNPGYGYCEQPSPAPSPSPTP
jgi:hypothetical protein